MEYMRAEYRAGRLAVWASFYYGFASGNNAYMTYEQSFQGSKLIIAYFSFILVGQVFLFTKMLHVSSNKSIIKTQNKCSSHFSRSQTFKKNLLQI